MSAAGADGNTEKDVYISLLERQKAEPVKVIIYLQKATLYIGIINIQKQK